MICFSVDMLLLHLYINANIIMSSQMYSQTPLLQVQVKVRIFMGCSMCQNPQERRQSKYRQHVQISMMQVAVNISRSR